MIRRFGKYNLQQLEQMKQDLNIQMPLNKLIFCQSYYRATEKRDPAIEELQFLDLFSKDSEVSPLSIAPTELLTNETFVASTYADMMSKRYEMRPDAKLPCSLHELMHLANTYLERVGKNVSMPSEAVCSLEKRSTPYTRMGESTVLEKSAELGLRVLQGPHHTLQTGDLLLLLRPLLRSTVNQNAIPLGSLLDTLAFASQIKQMRTVGKRGLLAELLSIISGATIEPDRLSQTGEPIPLSMLATAYEGDLLVRIARESYPTFAKAAYEAGIFAAAFATVGNDTRVTFIRPRGTTFSLQSRFLRLLFPLRPVSVRLGNEHLDTETPISHTPYIETCDAQSQTATVGRSLISAASVAPTKSFYRNALDTALATVLTLALSGCDYANQRLAVSLEIPQNTDAPHVAGACISMILGVYRLQAELAIPAVSIRLDCDPARTYPSLQTFAIAGGTAIPTQFTAAGNHVYCISPATTPDGLPDFSDLRRLLTLLTALRRGGILQSARVICHEEITDAIHAMTSPTLGCLTSGKELFSAGAFPVGVLIETNQRIDATRIGETTSRNPVAVSEVH